METLDKTQLEHAQTIIDVGQAADLPDRAIVIALMTALQESSLHNLGHGDRDSLGLFQQRPSQNWGTPAQLRNPSWAAKAFYGINPESANPGLIDIANWQNMTRTEAAQAVQRSAYPDAYAQWHALAEELLATLG